MKFHDGSDFTRRGREVLHRAHPHGLGPNPTTIYVRRVKETKIVDPLTVHVITDGAAADAAELLHSPLHLSHKAAAGLTKDRQRRVQFGKAAVGTGPYKYVSWEPKGDLVMDRFDGFWVRRSRVRAMSARKLRMMPRASRSSRRAARSHHPRSPRPMLQP